MTLHIHARKKDVFREGFVATRVSESQCFRSRMPNGRVIPIPLKNVRFCNDYGVGDDISCTPNLLGGSIVFGGQTDRRRSSMRQTVVVRDASMGPASLR
jgi:hypothetical protein